jgi:hypothetical protein
MQSALCDWSKYVVFCQNVDILGFVPNKQLADFVGGRILVWLQGYIGRFIIFFFFDKGGGGCWSGGGVTGPVDVLIAAPILPDGLLLDAQFLSPGSHPMCSLSSRVFQRNSSVCSKFESFCLLHLHY